MTPTNAPLEARYQMNSEDARAFEALGKGNSSGSGPQKLIRSMLALFALLIVASFVFSSTLSRSNARPAPVAASNSTLISALGLLVPMLIFGAFYFFILRANRKAQTKLPAFVEQNLMALNDNSATHVCGAYTNIVEWHGFFKVVASDAHIAFFTSAEQGYIVPRRAFDNEADWQAFVDFARDKWNRTQPVKPPIADA